MKLGVTGIKDRVFDGERFWVRLTSIENNIYRGTVQQADMVFTDLHGIRHDSNIRFERRHILSIDHNYERN